MKKQVSVKKEGWMQLLILRAFLVMSVILPQISHAAFSSSTAKNTIFGSSSIVADAITFVFWLLAFIEIIDFLSNLNTSGFFLKILRPAFMILFAAKWSTIVGWFI